MDDESKIRMLENAIKDAEWRIGSHVVATGEVDNYVKKQIQRIGEWSEELNSILVK
jgi:hypothetical protein